MEQIILSGDEIDIFLKLKEIEKRRKMKPFWVKADTQNFEFDFETETE